MNNLRPGEQGVSQRNNPIYRTAIDQSPMRIDRLSGILGTPGTDRIEIVQCKAYWVHHRMTAGAHRPATMEFKPRPQRFRHVCIPIFGKSGHIRRRRRRRRSQQVFEYPFAPDYR